MSGRILPFPPREPASGGPSAAPFVQRTSELSFLHQRLQTALAGQRQVVLLAGDPGIGKTALVDAFLSQLRRFPRLLITMGHCVEQYGAGEAYLPLLEATTRLCRGPSSQHRLALLQRYAPSWLAQLPSLLDPHEFVRLQQLAQGASRDRMLREMAEAAEGLAHPHGLVLILEDLHWSDVSTLDWFVYMARRREPTKLLILGTYRPTDALASGHPLIGTVHELQGQNRCEELPLTPLAPAGIAEYLTERFAVVANDRTALHDIAALLHYRTGGNPLFVVNTVNYLIQHGAVSTATGQWTLHADKIQAMGSSIPETIQLLIARQIERLPEAEQRLLEAASVAGADFAVAEVAAGLQTEPATIEDACERLARTGQFVRANGLVEWPDGTISGRYSFLHALYQEVLYARLAERQRVHLHRRIAEKKDHAYGEQAGEIAAELAVHWEKGRDFPRAVYYLGKAGDNAVRRSAHREAITLLTHGLTLLPFLPDTSDRLQQELQFQVSLGVSFINTKGPAAEEVEHTYARVWDISQQLDHTPQLFSALWGLAASYVVRSKFEQTGLLTEQMLAIAERAQNGELQLEASLMAGVFHLYSHGDVLMTRQHLERVRALYAPERHRAHAFLYGQDPGIFGGGLAMIALWCAGYPDQAWQRGQEVLGFVQQETAPYDQSIALIYRAFLHQHRGERELVRAPAEAVVTLTSEQGFALVRCWGTVLHGWALVEEGQLERGIAMMKDGITTQQAMGAEFLLVYFLSLLAEAHARAGHYAEGMRVVEEAFVKVETTGARLYEAELYRLYGELLLQVNETENRRQGEAGTSFPPFASTHPEPFDKLRVNQVAGRSGQLQRESSDPASDTAKRLAARRRGHDEHVIPSHEEPPVASRPPSPALNVFCKEGDSWRIAFRGTSFRLRHMRGLDYIAHLLRHPGVEFLALDLLTPAHAPGAAASSQRGALAEGMRGSPQESTEELLDAQAREQYRRRLAELRVELNEAQTFNDLGRQEKAQQEIDFLSAELARALGLQGRPRSVSTAAERARVNVKKGIRLALTKIAEHCVPLEHYLATNIKTGLFCSYTPPPFDLISWEL